VPGSQTGGLGRKLRKMRAAAGGLAVGVCGPGQVWMLRAFRLCAQASRGIVHAALYARQEQKERRSTPCSLCRSLRDASAAVLLAAARGPDVRGPICAAADAGLHCSWRERGAASYTNPNLFIAASRGFVSRIPQEPAPQTRLGASDRIDRHHQRAFSSRVLLRVMRTRRAVLRLLQPPAGRLRILVPPGATAGPIGSLSDG
jgi:hypothetical protein